MKKITFLALALLLLMPNEKYAYFQLATVAGVKNKPSNQKLGLYVVTSIFRRSVRTYGPLTNVNKQLTQNSWESILTHLSQGFQKCIQIWNPTMGSASFFHFSFLVPSVLKNRVARIEPLGLWDTHIMMWQHFWHAFEVIWTYFWIKSSQTNFLNRSTFSRSVC